MVNKWQDEVTPEEWESWMDFATSNSYRHQRHITTGPDEYAARAIEKLLVQENRPNNVEAWLTTTIKNLYIDRYRHLQAYGGIGKVDIDDKALASELLDFAVDSPSLAVKRQDEVDHILGLLTDKEREIVILAASGFDNTEIATRMGYASNRVVSARRKQIQEKVQKALLAEMEKKRFSELND